MIAFLIWYLLIVAIGLITFPLARKIFRPFTDSGYGLSKVLGMLLLAYIHWVLVSLGLLPNTQAGAAVSLFLLIALVWALTDDDHSLGSITVWFRSNVAELSSNRSVLSSEILFLVAFLFWAFVRSLNPDIGGTEKPMELAFINSIMRSGTFPPADPWLSGYAISYYHFGYVMTALIALLTGTEGSIAFNLMLALVIALASVASYSILYNLINRNTNKPNLLTPLSGPFFLTLVSNAEGFLEFLSSKGVGWENGVSGFWQWLNIKDLSVAPAVIGQWPPRFWFWWRASRVLQDYDLVGNFNEIIDEFPVFSFLLGDLHPHVLSIPFVLLVVGWGLSLLWSNEDDKFDIHDSQFWLLAIAVGGLAFLNTWDFPIYFSLVVTLQFMSIFRRSGWSKETGIELLNFVVPLGAISVLFYLPFYFGFSSQAGGILPNVIFPTRGSYIWIMFLPLLVPVTSSLLSLVRKTRSRILDGAMLTLLAVTLLAVFSTLLGWVASNTPDGAALIAGQGVSGYMDLLTKALQKRLEYSGGLITISVFLLMGLSIIVGFIRKPKDRKSLFLALLGTFAALLVLVPEFVYLRDQFGNRMNTVFKFYYEAWVLWSILAAYGLAKSIGSSRITVRIVSIGLILISTGIGLVYSVTALADKTDFLNVLTRSNITLDGSNFYQVSNMDEWQAVKWLQNQPNSVIVEAVGGSYTEFARISTFSGQATILGWPGHESQWRGGYNEIGSRQQDIEQIYTSTDWTATELLLKKYRAKYIVVGNLERSAYALNEEKFMNHMAVAFRMGNVTIYQDANYQ